MNYIVLLFSILGFISALIIYINNQKKNPHMCPRKGGCNLVTKGKYSRLFGFQNDILGMMYYTSLIVLIPFINIDYEVLTFVRTLSIFGFVFSIYFIYLQMKVIKSWCMWCVISAISSTVIFINLFQPLIL